jgi:hypothetical protein
MISQDVERVLTVAKEEGLSKAMLYYSSFINKAPNRRIRTNGYNTYTPQGQMTRPNSNYNKELTQWKKNKLFPFFIEHGYSKAELVVAFSNSVFKK